MRYVDVANEISTRLSFEVDFGKLLSGMANGGGGGGGDSTAAAQRSWWPVKGGGGRGAWSGKSIQAKKEQLLTAGFYLGSSKAAVKQALSNPQKWTPADAMAYKRMWSAYFSAGYGRSDGMEGYFLQQLADPANADITLEGAGQGGGGGSGRQVILSNPDDLKNIFRKTSQQVLGRELDDESLDHFVDTYHGAERTAAGGTVQAPTPQTAAEDELRKGHETEAGAHDMANQFNNFMQIIGAGGATGANGAPQ